MGGSRGQTALSGETVPTQTHTTTRSEAAGVRSKLIKQPRIVSVMTFVRNIRNCNRPGALSHYGGADFVAKAFRVSERRRCRGNIHLTFLCAVTNSSHTP